MRNYDDIIHLERPISKHKKLGDDSRAAQFAPFAALTGYDGQIKEVARITENKIELSDEEKELLNSKLNYLNEHLKSEPEVTFVYFISDKKKEGGKYTKKKGKLKRIDAVNCFVKFQDNFILSMDDIIDIEINLYNEKE